MQDRFKQLLNKILEMWNKYTKKQKTIILSTVGAVVIMLLLLAYFFGRTTYTRWRTFEDVGVAKSVDQLLTESGIAHRIADDSVTIYVDSSKTVEANYAIVGSSLMEEGRVTLEDLLKSDMSTTNYEKNIKSAEYTMAELESYIEKIDGVDKAQVRYVPIDRTSTILDENKEIQCSIFLTINSKFNTSVAPESISRFSRDWFRRRAICCIADRRMRKRFPLATSTSRGCRRTIFTVIRCSATGFF